MRSITMWRLDNYYYENIKPIVKDFIIDWLDLGNKEAPGFDDLECDEQQSIAGKLFLNEPTNLDMFDDFNIRESICSMMNLATTDSITEVSHVLRENIVEYYKSTIDEILMYEFKEIKSDYEDGLCEEIEYENHCIQFNR